MTSMLPTTKMSFMIAFAALLLATGISAPLYTADAATLRAEREYALGDDTRISDDLYIVGRDVVFKGVVEGDIVAFGARAEYYGSTSGDVLLAGGAVEFNGTATGDVRIAGGEVTIRGVVDEDLVVAAGTLIVSRDALIKGDLIVFAQNIIIEGTVDGVLEAHGTVIALGGTVRGPVIITAQQSVAVTDTARLEQTFTYRAPREMFRTDAATISGAVEYTPSAANESDSHRVNLVGYFLRVLVSAAGAVTLLLLASRHVGALVDTVLERSGRALLTGIGVALLTPFVALLIMITVIGIMPALALVALWGFVSFVALMLSPIVVGVLLVTLLQKQRLVLWSWTVLGAFTLALILSVPFVGVLAGMALYFLSVGAISMRLLEVWKGLRSDATPVDPIEVGEPSPTPSVETDVPNNQTNEEESHGR